MTIIPIQIVFLQDIARLIQYGASVGIMMTGGRCYSTPDEQKVYFDKGLSKTLNSAHCNRLAMDFNYFLSVNGMNIQLLADVKNKAADKKTLMPLAYYWCSLDAKNTCGLVWGWDFYHFERKV